MEAMQRYEVLLEQVRALTLRYDRELHGPQADFNVFSLLREDGDEVNLHSRFLYELLDSRGCHGLGDTFLRLFVEQLHLEPFELPIAESGREHHNIDIFLGNSHGQAIVIENKIYARDQHRQLMRYDAYARQAGYRDVRLIYLSLDGHEPPAESRGSVPMDQVCCASYREDIRCWLESCAKEASLFPVLRETIVQYRNLVLRLTGQSPSKEYTMRLVELILKDNHVEFAKDILVALEEAKATIQYGFWEGLERMLSTKGFKLVPDTDHTPKYTMDRIRGFVAKRRGSAGYGLWIESIQRISPQERLFFSVGIDGYAGIYFGFKAAGGDSEKTHSSSSFNALADILSKMDPTEFDHNDEWIGWVYKKPKMDFLELNAEVIPLKDAESREDILSRLVDQIEQRLHTVAEEAGKRGMELSW